MTDLLFRNADTVPTMQDDGTALPGADILIRDGVIRAVGQGLAAAGAPGHVSLALRPNDERAAGGVRAVSENTLLTDAAPDHATDMVANDCMSRTDPDGGRAPDRAAAAGHDRGFIAETIAQGHGAGPG